jgi:hypothetical protein
MTLKAGSTKVALVLDPGYGEQLRALAAEMAVWIIGSPVNVAVAKDIWKQPAESPHVVTTFEPDTFEGLLDSIELHHGHYSQAPAFQELEVVGLMLNAEAQQVLQEYGFESETITEGGFVASRAPNAGTSHEEHS